MRQFSQSLVILAVWVSVVCGSITESGVVSPLYLATPETDTVFRNPAELPLYRNLIGGRGTYGIRDERFGGSFILHIPDFGLGHWGFSAEFYGSDLGQNVVWVDDPSATFGGRFALSRGGGKLLYTWAKKTRFLTVGASLKHIVAKDTDVAPGRQTGLGVDVGAFLTPFKDLYLGAVINDVSGTTLRDQNQNVTLEIAQVARLSAAVVSGDDMSFSVGVPVDFVDDIREDPKNWWKRTSFHGRKVFDDWLAISAGYNTKDLFGSIGFKLNDFFSIGLIGSRDLFHALETNNFTPNEFTVTFTYALPYKTIKKYKEEVGDAPEEVKPWQVQDYMYYQFFGKPPGYRQRYYQRRAEKARRLEERIQELEYDLQRQQIRQQQIESDAQDSRIRKIEKELDEQDQDEEEVDEEDLEDELDAEIRRLKRKKKRLEELKKSIRKDLE